MKTRIRRAVVAVVAASFVAGATAPAALASHWWWWNGHQVHLAKGNFPSISFRNNAVNGTATALEHARGDWAADPALDLYNVSGAADVTAWDGNWTDANWGGLATPAAFDGHAYGQMWVQINTTGNPPYNWRRGASCQEIGHAVGGMDHAGPGCMGLGYEGTAPAANNNFNDPAVRVPSAHDRAHTWFLWAGGVHP